MKRRKHRQWGLALAAVSIILTVAAAAKAQADTKYVNSKCGLNLRRKPDEVSEVLEVLPYGAPVLLADDETPAGRYHICMDETDGYVSARYLQNNSPLDDLQPLGQWLCTAYAYTGSRCANGNYPKTGYTIACNSLPFGTEVYIDGIGFRTVEDRGPDSMGSEWLDIYMEDEGACIQFGAQRHMVYAVPSATGE